MSNLQSYLISAVFGLLLLIVFHLKRKYNFWKSRGVYHREPHPIYGNSREYFKAQKSIGEHILDLYTEFKSKGLKFAGYYMASSPVLVPMDPSLIKNIVQTDFDHFISHGTYVNEEVDPLTGHLFNLDGARWKSMRTRLTPTFTSGKMRMMFETLATCADGLKDLIQDESKDGEALEMSEILGRFTTDVIGSCAFGLNCNSMQDPDSKFREKGKKSFEKTKDTLTKSLARALLPQFVIKSLRMKVTQQDVEDFFMEVVRNIVEYREKNNVYRKDFMHLMLQLKNRGLVADDEKIFGDQKIESTITMNELTAQCFVFFAAGFETSSTAMSFALYELAVNQDVQNKLREEIDGILNKSDGKITFEAVKSMDYLDRVVQETLRKYPPVPLLPRVCNKTYKIPESDVTITPKTAVHIPVLGIHMDPDYYPEPEKFDPERFTKENIAKRPQYTFLPFGEGPRICIGMRFGVMQTKVGLVSIIRNYKVGLSEKTRVPFQYDPRKNVMTVKGGMWLNVTKV